MKNFKRITRRGLSLFMALIMCMSVMSLTAFAEDDGTGETEITAGQDMEPAGIEAQDPVEDAEPVGEEEPAQESTETKEIMEVGEARETAEAVEAAAVPAATSLSPLFTTAQATDSGVKKVFTRHTSTDDRTTNLAKIYNTELSKLANFKDGQWPNWEDSLVDGQLDVWTSSSDMKDDGITDRSVLPYFYAAGGKFRLKEIEVHAGNSVTVTKDDEPTTLDQFTYTVSKDTLDAHSAYDNSGRVVILYVWEFVNKDENDPTPPKPTTYTVQYSLNQSANGADGQLPSNVKVSGGGSAWLTDSGLRKPFEIGANGSFRLFPTPSDVIDVNKLSADGYDLLGWKCADAECGKCSGENATFHQVGEDVEATAARAGEDKTITLTAQWKKWEVPSLEEIGELDLSNDPPMLVLATVNGKGEMVKITQHSAETGEAVTDELMLDPTTSEIYYEATVKMAPSVAGSLKAYIPKPDFARFKITVNMAEQLKLAGIDEDGMVEFTFTCPFLEPVPRSEVLVDGQPVLGVEVNTDKSPYTYKVPADSLTREDGTIKPFSFLVQWRSTITNGNIYSADDLSAPMTLKTAKAIATSKVPFETTGSVTGWINPKGNLPQNPNQEKGLAYAILNNSPTLKKYLITDKGLSYEQATSVMLDYLASTDGQNASMNREILPANKLEAYVPCVVTFNSNGGSAVASQYIKYQTTAQPTAPTRDGYTFTGWTLDGTAYEFTTPVIGDITLTAQWTRSILPTPVLTITPSATSLTGGGTVTLTISGPDGTTVSASPSVTLTSSGSGTYTVTLPNSTQTYTFTASFPGSAAYAPASVSCTVAVTYRTTGGGSGGGGGGGSAGRNPTNTGATITDQDVPLAGDLQLNKQDHFAYIKGYQDGTVRPNNPITRAQVATIFYRLLDDTSRIIYFQDTNDFTDVSDAYWANKAISTLTNAGVITGFSDGTFRPDANITRAQFTAMAARFDSVVPGLNNPFTDVAEDYWARDLIAYAADRGWVSSTMGQFRPLENITRVEVMDFLNNVLERRVDAEGILADAATWSDVPVTDPNYYVVEEATNSHDFERRTEGQLMENWTQLTEDPVWDE